MVITINKSLERKILGTRVETSITVEVTDTTMQFGVWLEGSLFLLYLSGTVAVSVVKGLDIELHPDGIRYMVAIKSRLIDNYLVNSRARRPICNGFSNI
jgi:hypothetical protein